MSQTLLERPAPPAVESPAAGDTVDAHRARLTRRRRLIVGAVASLAALAVADVAVGAVGHRQRQEHLVVAFADPVRVVTPGEALMVLQIPSIGVNEIVTQGAAAPQLRAGPGHVIGTSMPGAPGNTVVLGHHSRDRGPFARLASVSAGDHAVLKTRSGLVRTYRVDAVRHAPAGDRSALAPTRRERLTLVTSSGGPWPGSLEVVTATPVAGAATVPSPGTPVRRLRYDPPADALDEGAGLGALAASIALGAALALAGRLLATRYRRLTVALLLAPAMGLLALSLLGLIDALGPSTW